MSLKPEFAILIAPGTNCEKETQQALDVVGAIPCLVHINDLKNGRETIDDYQGLVIPGGFSYGDIVRAGAIFAHDLRNSYVADQVNAFADEAKPIVGTCNGNQVLTETGLLAHGRIDPEDETVFTLSGNDSGKFECRWVRLLIENSGCLFIPEKDRGRIIELPVAHAEGRFTAKSREDADTLLARGQVVLRYCDIEGNPTETYPANPNGSPLGIAATCSPNYAIFGMMPHDERFSRREHHPNWRRSDVAIPSDFTAKILSGAVAYAKES